MNWDQLYKGYINTPPLWSDCLDGIRQFELDATQNQPADFASRSTLRLGKVAENFTFEYWSNFPDIEVLCKNLQIEGNERTLGEIDALIRYKHSPIHIEIAYKFYLYDPEYGSNELAHWIGPNRKDSFVTKLERLKIQQLVLPNTPEAKELLSQYIHPEEKIVSEVWMKGQLFIPYNQKIDAYPLNQNCISGSYIKVDSLHSFNDCKFHLPSKLEWLSAPNTNVNWKHISQIQKEIQPLLDKEFSPMLWVKRPNGKLEKLFIVWW